MPVVKFPSFLTSVRLLLRVRNLSDGAAWGRFVEQYRPLIYRWCFQRGLPPGADAEEVLSTVLLRLVRELPRFTYEPERGRFRDWLRTMVLRVLQDYRRSLARQPVPHDNLEEHVDPNAVDLCAGEMTLEISSQMEKLAVVLARVQKRVRPTTWEAFQRSTLQDQPASEVGQALRIGVTSVYVHKHRVIQLLKEEWDRLASESQE